MVGHLLQIIYVGVHKCLYPKTLDKAVLNFYSVTPPIFHYLLFMAGDRHNRVLWTCPYWSNHLTLNGCLSDKPVNLFRPKKQRVETLFDSYSIFQIFQTGDCRRVRSLVAKKMRPTCPTARWKDVRLPSLSLAYHQKLWRPINRSRRWKRRAHSWACGVMTAAMSSSRTWNRSWKWMNIRSP